MAAGVERATLLAASFATLDRLLRPLRRRLPFRLHHWHSDNGGGFLNEGLLRCPPRSDLPETPDRAELRRRV